MPYVDLHVHTRYSDGVDPPADVVRRAVDLGFAALAVTDHDTVVGVPEADEAARALGVGFLRGTEISAEYEGVEIHVVGLGIRVDYAPLLDALRKLCVARDIRAARIIERLNAIGVPIRLEDVAARASDQGATGRMHIAQQIVALGYAKEVQHAFDRYLNPGRPAFVRKTRMACADAIDIVHQADGLAFLAHPGIGAVYRVINKLLTLPFDGIEAYHVQHDPGQVTQYLELAKETGRLVGGRSDCHGRAKSEPEMGKVRVPYEHFERILNKLAS